MSALAAYLGRHRNTVLTALPGILLAVVATWWFLFRGPAPALRHTPYLRPDTAVRVVLCPARVQSYVSGLAPMATRLVHSIPQLSSMQGAPIHFDWLHKMPVEMAFLFDQALPGRFGVTLFFQEHPTGEALDQLVNGSSFLADLQPIYWSSPQLRREPGGALLIDGQLDIPPEIQRRTDSIWPQSQPVEPPRIEGSHFLEIGINNCNGALLQLHGALANMVAPWADEQLQEIMRATARTVISASATADLAENDCLRFNVELRCIDGPSAEALAIVCRAVGQALGSWLQTVHGFRLEGTANAEQARIMGAYELRGFEARLRHALGG